MQEAGQPPAKVAAEEPKPAKETAQDSLPASEDSFVIISDVDIVGEHLDEVFYGEGAPAGAPPQREREEACEAGMRSRRESQRSAKESGSVLFETEETTLTPIFISPGPPKIIDPILLEEPTAMSFMYSDLYEDAVGERRKSDEEHSESESVASEKTSKRRLSDSEEADGYLEKFILKDETPTVDVPLESMEDRREGRMMWAQSKFEMTGCLTRAAKEEGEVKGATEETKETKERDMVFEGREEDAEAAMIDVTEGQMTEMIETKSSREEPKQGLVVRNEGVEAEDQSQRSGSSTGQEGLTTQPISSKDERTESLRVRQTQEVAETTDQDVMKVTEESDGGGPSEIPAEITKESSSGEAAADTEKAEEVVTAGQEGFTATGTENEGKEAAAFEDAEVTASMSHTSVEDVDKPGSEEEIQSDLIDLQGAGSVPETAEGMSGAERPEPGFLAEAETEGDGEKPVTSEEAESRSDGEVHEPKAHPEEETAAAGASTDAQEKGPTGDSGDGVHQKKAAQDFVLHVPKGQAVEMDIEISPVPLVTTDDSKSGDLTPPCVSMDTESPQLSPQLPDDGSMTEPQLEVKADDAQEQTDPPCPPAPAGDATSDRQEAETSEGILSSLRSFVPQEDLSTLLEEEQNSEAKSEGEEVEMGQVGGVREAAVDEERCPETEEHREDKEPRVKPEEVNAGDVSVEELDYEVIWEQEAKEMRDEEPQPEPGLEDEEREEKGVFDLSPEEEHIEDDYEIFDAEEERQARMAAELQGLDWFCFTCGDLLSKDDRASEEHRTHKVIDVDAAYEEIKVKRDTRGCLGFLPVLPVCVEIL